MKKIMNTSLIYCVLAMAGGVLSHEFTKWNGYTEPTTLGVLHVHLLVLGTGVFLLAAAICKSDRTGKEFFI